MGPPSTPTRENKQYISIVFEPPPGTPILVPPVTPPSSTHSDCDPLTHDISVPLTPASSTCEMHCDYRPPTPYTIPPVPSPFSIPSVVGENGFSLDLTPTQPAIVVEKSIITWSPDWHRYWIKIIDMEPIKAFEEATRRNAEKATQAIRDKYVDKLVYIESVKPLGQYEMVHATWTAIIMWHKTGKISGLSIGRTPLDMRSVEHKDPPLFRLEIMFDIMRQYLFKVLCLLSHLFSQVASLLSIRRIFADNNIPCPLIAPRLTIIFATTT